jgi:hypothetical protein
MRRHRLYGGAAYLGLRTVAPYGPKRPDRKAGAPGEGIRTDRYTQREIAGVAVLRRSPYPMAEF